MAIERRLTELIGPLGGKLHTGRSRNDQVALDLRLWLRAECDALDADLARLQRALVAVARRHRDAVLPGYTHLQRAQPVLLAHHLLAYHEMLARDRGRFRDCRARADELPLGAGALAGAGLRRSTAPTSRGCSASRASPRNSLDAVGDRDAAVEFLAAAAIAAVHLSRLAEELVLWASEEFGFVQLPDAFATGSSMMPQKKNPDVAELVRGKTGRVLGALVALLTTLKGLPLAYNRDLQEDKALLFDAARDAARAASPCSPRCCRRSASTPHAWRRPPTGCSSPPTSPTCWSSAACRSATRTRSSAGSCATASRPARRFATSTPPRCAATRRGSTPALIRGAHARPLGGPPPRRRRHGARPRCAVSSRARRARPAREPHAVCARRWRSLVALAGGVRQQDAAAAARAGPAAARRRRSRRASTPTGVAAHLAAADVSTPAAGA